MGALIWLASYPKSGNTWLRAFLHNLLLNPDQATDINKLDQICFGDSQINWFTPFLAGRDPRDVDENELMRLRQQVQLSFSQSRAESVFVKTHNMLAEFSGNPLVNMEITGGAIYILRNPLDVCISLADHAGLGLDDAIALMNDPTGRTYTDEANIFEIHGGWSRHVESWTGHNSSALHWLKYEDLLRKPVKYFAEICSYLELDPPRARLRKAVEFSSFRSLRQQEKRGGFRERSTNSEKFFRVGKAEQWRKVLTRAQIDQVIAANGEQMQKFGYLP